EVYKFDATLGWQAMPALPAMSAGWDAPQNYSTIHVADVDGDGKAELIGRGGEGVELYAYNPQTQAWSSDFSFTEKQDPKAAWSDANNWNLVQHYSTIQSARVLLPGDRDYTDDGARVQAVLLGRGSLGMQTWRYDNNLRRWVQASASLPEWTETQKVAYQAICTVILGQNYGKDFRARYNDYNNILFGEWQRGLYSGESPVTYDQKPQLHSTLLPIPPGIEQDVWDSVAWQIWWELQWVRLVNDWYGSGKAGGLVDKETITEILTLQTVGNYLSIPQDSSLETLFDVLALIAGVAAAILTGGAALAVEGAALGVASAIAGGAAATFSFVPSQLPGQGGAYQVAYQNLQGEIDKTFNAALKNTPTLLFHLTGGGVNQPAYVPPDYGRLKQIGNWLQDGSWSWPNGPTGSPTSALVLLASRGYAINYWKVLLAAQPWYAFLNKWHPDEKYYYHHFKEADGDREFAWILTSSFSRETPVDLATLSALFDDTVTNNTFPLKVSLPDVYEGKNGWPSSGYDPDVNAQYTPPQALPPSLGVDIRSMVTLTRDVITNEVVATLTLVNQGMTPATNVEITGATLGGRSVIGNHAQRQMRLFTGQSQTILLHFVSLTPGASTV
ncbi:MAG: hypothetical protein V4671_00970, partial [Armatimonadota bacterium]